jgi:chromosome partitioning protein
MSALITAVANQKGGVGKTTTTTHLCRSAVLAGHRVLMIEADAQGNLSLGVCPSPPQPDWAGYCDLLNTATTDRFSITALRLPTRWPGVDIVVNPAGAAATHADRLSTDETILARKLAAVREEYDWIVIDCSPAFDILTRNALVAADEYVVLTEPSMYTFQGTATLVAQARQLSANHGTRLELRGLIVNKVQASRAAHTAAWQERLGKIAPVLTPMIPLRAAIADAASAGWDLDESTTTRDLQALYDELYTAVTTRRNPS